jgi:hypothetical protein
MIDRVQPMYFVCCDLARSAHIEGSVRLSAFGAKRTSRERRERADLTKMTQSGHEQAAFAAMHSLTCYSS